jgi:hypothetical protein
VGQDYISGAVSQYPEMMVGEEDGTAKLGLLGKENRTKL